MAPLVARATRCWLRVRISTRFVAYGRVLTERFARHRASAGDDYACGRRLAHLPLHVVSGENLVWVSWMDYDWAWALQSPWRRRLLDHRRLFLVGFLFCALLLLLILHFSACFMALPEPPSDVQRSKPIAVLTLFLFNIKCASVRS
jgi:hypothetical protein